MALVRGDQSTAETLKTEGVDSIFYLMGGPINAIIPCGQREGSRTIDTERIRRD